MDMLRIACVGLAATAVLAFVRPDIVAAQNSATPPAPVAAPLPPVAPDAPNAVSAEPAMPAPPADVTGPDDDEAAVDVAAPAPVHKHHRHVHVVRIENGKVIEDAMRDIHMDQAEIARAAAQARRAQAEIRKIQPEIERAIAEARIDERVANAMRDVDPKIRADVARALEQARPAIRRAIADAHISERVAEALQEAQPKIDAAIVRIQKRIDKDGNLTIRREDHGDDMDVQSDDEGDADSNDK